MVSRSPRLFTILDCQLVAKPFAARVLHEVVRHWINATREMVAFFPSGRVEMALVMIRRLNVQEVLSWGQHPRATVRQALAELQALWVTDGDLDDETVNAPQPEEGILRALHAAEKSILGKGDALKMHGAIIEVWTFQLDEVVNTLQTVRGQDLVERLKGLGMEIILVALSMPPDTNQNVISQARGSLQIANVLPTSAGILRHLRRYFSSHLVSHLHLRRAFGGNDKDSFGFDNGLVALKELPPVRCNCSTTVIRTAVQQEETQARLEGQVTIDLTFEHIVDRQSVKLVHQYGVPFVAYPAGAASMVSALAKKLAERSDGLAPDARANAAFIRLCRSLWNSEGLAVFSGRLCPFGLAPHTRRSFFAATPSNSDTLVFQGILCYNVASPMVGLRAVHDGSELEQEVDEELEYDCWRFEEVFNPLRHHSKLTLAEFDSEAAVVDEAKLVAASLTSSIVTASTNQSGVLPRGRGRPTNANAAAAAREKAEIVKQAVSGQAQLGAISRGRGRPASVVSARSLFTPAVEIEEINVLPQIGRVPLNSEVGTVKPLQAQAAYTTRHEETPFTTQSGDKQALAELVPMLRHSKRRRTREISSPKAQGVQSCDDGVHLTAGDVESIAAGSFAFPF